MKLRAHFAKRVQSNFSRQAITSASRWAKSYRIGYNPFLKETVPWTFKYHPWSEWMHDVRGNLVGMKAAQMAYTETALNKALAAMDLEHKNVAYYLPSFKPDAYDFSSARFDGCLDQSPYIKAMFSSRKNVGHKRAGGTNFYIRGLRSRSGAKSIDVALMLFDEVDEMVQKLITLAMERTSGQPESEWFKLSTPTISKFGIDVDFQKSTKRHYFFKCPRCSRFEEINFPENIIITADDPQDPKIKDTHIICTQCKKVLPHETKPDWLAPANGAEWIQQAVSDLEGVQINQFYSCATHPWEIAKLYLEGLSDEASEQEFHNSKLGKTHEVSDARVSESDINGCVGDFVTKEEFSSGGVTTLGVDVGTALHFQINQWKLPKRGRYASINARAIPRVINYGTVSSFNDISHLMKKFNINFAVLDANPERRKVKEFCDYWYGRSRACFYIHSVSGKTIKVSSDRDEPDVKVNRTAWMDMTLSRYRQGKIHLPRNINHEYRTHIQEPVRVPEKDANGNITYRYITGQGRADHYAHAATYAEIALPLALSVGKAKNIASPL